MRFLTSPTILFGLCGHGHFDMMAYTDHASSKLQDLSYDEAMLQESLAGLPRMAAE
jgi:tryptophan synthase beta chain